MGQVRIEADLQAEKFYPTRGNVQFVLLCPGSLINLFLNAGSLNALNLDFISKFATSLQLGNPRKGFQKAQNPEEYLLAIWPVIRCPSEFALLFFLKVQTIHSATSHVEARSA